MSVSRKEHGPGERLRTPIAVSATLHGALLVASVAWGILNPPISLGSRDAAGGGGIVAVSSVPINVARSDIPNPVANPTSHNVPAPDGFRSSTELEQPQPEPSEEAEAPPPDSERRKAEQQRERSVGQRSAGEAESNELRSSRGAALSSELYRTGRGAYGFGGDKGGPFGTRFGWYAQIIQRAIGQEWRKELGKVGGSSSKPVVATFVINRSGRIDRVAVSQSSGNRQLDYSAVRAIRGASPVPPLPPALGRRSVTIEMHFNLV